MSGLKYKRVLLKLSGEALMGEEDFGISPDIINKIADEIKYLHDLGAELAIVVGGGNIFRGVKGSAKLGVDQASGDYVGMLATVMNASILQGVLRKKDVSCRVLSAITINEIAEPYIRFRAMRHLEKGRVVIFAAGTGNPFFTTDTAAALRASEIDAEMMLMAKNRVDGVYDSDPKENPNAKRYDFLTYDEILHKDLKVMDAAAISLCKNSNIPIAVFDFAAKGCIEKILKGEKIGTFVGGKDAN
ncbi:MAG: UMP kinase [Candidatus Gastranaerophilales bacterium]|nr:UMP kinase [Candidatus Gastranaerophilales bacterium]